MKRKRRRFALKLVFLSLFILLGILVAQSGRLILSIRPPIGNPSLENIEANPGENRQATASANGMKGGFTPIPWAPEPPVTESVSDEQAVSDSAPSAEPGPASDEIYYFLVAGFDVAYTNAEAILLAGLNITDKTLRVLSIPRDTMSGSGRLNKKINAAWEQGGIVQLEKEVADLTGIMVNRYILTTLEGMQEMSNALGGISGQDLHIHLSSGQHPLTDHQVVQLAPYRSGNRDGDPGYIAMQQELIMAIAEQALRSTDMAKLAELAGLALEHIETDLTMGEMLWLVETLKATSFEDVRFYTLPGRLGTMDGLSYWIPDKEAIAAIIKEFR